MLKEVTFSNLYTFVDTQTIQFNSDSMLYSIYGPNCSGKSKLLSVIGSFMHSLWNKPNYNHLHNIINKTTGSQVIPFAFTFTFNQSEYTFTGKIDLAIDKYKYQKLQNNSTNQCLFEYHQENLISDVLLPKQIESLLNFNISKNGICYYIHNLEYTKEVEELQSIRNRASKQDYITIIPEELNNNKSLISHALQILRKYDPNLIDIKFISSLDHLDYKVQGTPVELSDPYFNHTYDLELVFEYENYSLGLFDQPSGIQNIFELSVELFITKDDNYFLPRIVDDISSSLDNQLFNDFLDLYLKYANRQIIFATHNDLILRDKILPKESIIFTNKVHNVSTVKKLSEFKRIRIDNRHNWQNMYHNGKFK